MARRDQFFSCSSRTDVCALNRSLWRPEAQPNILVPSSPSFADLGAPRSLSLLIDEDVRLFLIGALRLDGQFSRHDRGVVTVVGAKTGMFN